MCRDGRITDAKTISVVFRCLGVTRMNGYLWIAAGVLAVAAVTVCRLHGDTGYGARDPVVCSKFLRYPFAHGPSGGSDRKCA